MGFQAEMASIFHFQWDTFDGHIVDSSHSFKQCPTQFYRPNNNPNEIISKFSNMNGLFDTMQNAWIHLVGNSDDGIAPDIMPKTCIDVNRDNKQECHLFSIQEHQYEYS